MLFFDRDIPVYFQTRNLQILATEVFKDSKGIPRNVFPNILIPMPPENFTPHCQSGFPLKLQSCS